MGGRSVVAVFRRRTSISCCLFVFTVAITGVAQPSPRNSRSPFGDTVSVVQLRVPEKARTLFKRALDEFHRNELADSLKHVNAALAVDPGFPNALTLRGYMELTSKDFDAARTDLEHALDADPNFATAYLYLGAALNRLGLYDEALRRLERHTELHPHEWESYFEMSKSWMAKHEYQRSLDTINHASQLGADAEVAAAVHFVRGRALAGIHQYATAKLELQKCLDIQGTGGMADLTRELLTIVDRESAIAAK